MTYKPSWNKDVSPYLRVKNVDDEIAFLQNVFGASVIEASKSDDGQIFHAELQLGDSVVMIGQASNEWPATKDNAFVYLADVHKTHKTALQHGAKTILEPSERPYGNIESGFVDPQHNTWWLAQRIKP